MELLLLCLCLSKALAARRLTLLIEVSVTCLRSRYLTTSLSFSLDCLSRRAASKGYTGDAELCRKLLKMRKSMTTFGGLWLVSLILYSSWSSSIPFVSSVSERVLV
uniref:Putative secreted protein n=1 Tax=Anopheles darlingi TaxID=43151 RepID=A0A2M4DBD8_ANODA